CGQAKGLLATADPSTHRDIAAKIKAALMRKTRIGQQCDIGERQRLADHKPRRLQATRQSRQCREASPDLVSIEFARLPAEKIHLVAANRDSGLVAVLFPEQPFI